MLNAQRNNEEIIFIGNQKKKETKTGKNEIGADGLEK